MNPMCDSSFEQWVLEVEERNQFLKYGLYAEACQA